MSSRAEVGDLVRDDLPGAVDAVVASVREQVPAYAELSTAQRAEVAAIAGWAIERVLDLWVRDEGLTPADVRRFEGIGAARALDGRPLPGVLRAYRVGAARVTDLVADVGADLLTVGDALALTTLWMAVLDLLSEAMWTGHSRATDRVTADRRVALGDLLADIVAGRQSVRTALADRCRELEVVLPARPVVVVSTGPAPDGAVLATVQEDVWSPCSSTVPRSGPAGPARSPPRAPRTCRGPTGSRTWWSPRRPTTRSAPGCSTRETPRCSPSCAAHRDADPLRLARPRCSARPRTTPT